MRLLLISNSTNPGEGYLEYPKQKIAEFLCDVPEITFIPYAAVGFTYDDYLYKVQAKFAEFGIRVSSVHRQSDPAAALETASGIVIGGGNTFHLLREMQRLGLLPVIRRRVWAGIPYVGWSAGSNVACPTIGTTNDMPIVQPVSFDALGLIPFQINPHYLDTHPVGHAGETREQRIQEYIAANPTRYVTGLREGCMLHIRDKSIELIGNRPLRVFHYGLETKEYNRDDDLSFLLEGEQQRGKTC